jgi:hypothetical protein
MDDEITTGCLECIQLKEAFRKATLALAMHHDEHESLGEPEPALSCAGRGEGAAAIPRGPGIKVKDIAYIHKEAELYEANNKARRAWNEHREKVHDGMAFA